MEKSYGFLFWAYTIIWLGIVAYVGYLAFRLRRATDRIERLERKLATRGEGRGQNASTS